MIETKEQYSNVLEQMNQRGLSGSAAAAHETIEALREVATAGESLLMLLGAVGGRASLAEIGPDADILEEKLDALPDWIKEDG